MYPVYRGMPSLAANNTKKAAVPRDKKCQSVCRLARRAFRLSSIPSALSQSCTHVPTWLLPTAQRNTAQHSTTQHNRLESTVSRCRSSVSPALRYITLPFCPTYLATLVYLNASCRTDAKNRLSRSTCGKAEAETPKGQPASQPASQPALRRQLTDPMRHHPLAGPSKCQWCTCPFRRSGPRVARARTRQTVRLYLF
jgi:hypothetical protein